MKLTPENITRRLDTLQQRIEYSFSDRDLLLEALTHKSFSNENPGLAVACNERLEFLGDAVLDLVISQRTFLDYPDLQEGDLTRVRAELVREKSLSAIARRGGTDAKPRPHVHGIVYRMATFSTILRRPSFSTRISTWCSWPCIRSR